MSVLRTRQGHARREESKADAGEGLRDAPETGQTGPWSQILSTKEAPGGGGQQRAAVRGLQTSSLGWTRPSPVTSGGLPDLPGPSSLIRITRGTRLAMPAPWVFVRITEPVWTRL